MRSCSSGGVTTPRGSAPPCSPSLAALLSWPSASPNGTPTTTGTAPDPSSGDPDLARVLHVPGGDRRLPGLRVPALRGDRDGQHEPGAAGLRSVVVVCRVVFAKVPDRLPSLPLGAASLVAIGAGLLIAPTWQAPAGLMLGVVVMAVGVTFSTPAFFSAIFATATPSERGAAAGTASAFIDLGVRLRADRPRARRQRATASRGPSASGAGVAFVGCACGPRSLARRAPSPRRPRVTRMDVLVEVVRSGLVESRHRGVAVRVDPAGEVLWSIGDPDTVIFPRSANKPFQALGMMRAGLPLDGAELALAAASHSGEPFHLDGRACRARARRPRRVRAPDAAVVPARPEGARAAAARRGRARADPDGLLGQARGDVADVRGQRLADRHVPRSRPPAPADDHRDVRRAHRGAARRRRHRRLRRARCSPRRSGASPPPSPACWPRRRAPTARRLVDAMLAHPEYVSGTRRDELHLMRAVPGLVAKEGAESVLVVGLPDGSACALKIEDGGDPAALRRDAPRPRDRRPGGRDPARSPVGARRRQAGRRGATSVLTCANPASCDPCRTLSACIC